MKNDALLAAADLLVARTADILAANELDVARAQQSGTTATVIDRLRLNAARVEAMAAGLRQVAALADPVGEITEGYVRPNGLRVEKMRVPLGVVAIIYENRPNVTSDAAGLVHQSRQRGVPQGQLGRHRFQPGDRGRAPRRADQSRAAR